MKLTRLFTRPGIDPLDEVQGEKRRSVITNPDGSIVFESGELEVPHGWSQLATDIMASKYFRRRGVPTAEGMETSVRQVVHRIVHSVRQAGQQMGGYFASDEDAEIFEAELSYVLVHQMGAFNSPVWFNCGLFQQYGIEGSGGNFAWDFDQKAIVPIENNYARPQCSACFIQSVDDDLMSIFDLVKTEARIFKYGSGTGTNFSRLRGKNERLSGGGTSSGLMSFLEVFDRGAGATKSGGTTRRAAKMVCLDIDHPEIVDFINWKVHEEDKARILIEKGGMPADFNGEAYQTVGGQNSNNSVRVSDEFMQAAAQGKQWGTYARTTGELADRHDAPDLLDQVCRAAWRCADPGLQFDTTINDWHTCPNTEKIRASNPCSEYMFLDDSACNLASINLTKFLDEDGNFDLEAFRHTVRIFVLAQEILVDFASYPTERIARNSHDYRPLGLGYANMGAMLMVLGIPYDSPEGRAMCGAITALMTGHAYRVSAEIAAGKGTFEGYPRNARPMMRVIHKHREACDHISAEFCPSYLIEAARTAWDEAIEAGKTHGYRNAQTTVLAPTGTIGLLMDCDTTGIEPDFSLVKFKKLAGGGYFKIVNNSVPAALRRLGYTSQEIEDILIYINGTMTFRGAPHLSVAALKAHGFNEEDLAHLESHLKGIMDIRSVFHPVVLRADLLERLGIAQGKATEGGEGVLRALGYTTAQIDEASLHICGRLTVEGAPHLKEGHYPVFDCASRCGTVGKRFIAPMGHVRMMAAAQPFISGAISKTVNLPNEATAEQIREIYEQSWRLGLKAISIYRDNCKLSQPLSAGGRDQKETEASGEGKKSASEVFEEAYAEAERSAAPGTVSIKVPSLLRRRLPKRRHGLTVESRVGSHKIYLRTGEYEDGTLGEIFIDMHKEGAAFRSMMNCFAIAVSKGLQYGVPLKEFVDTFTFTRFEPQGMCDHPNIKMATSVIDFVFRVLGMEYLGRTDFVQVKPEQPAEAGNVVSVTDSSAEAEAFATSSPAESARVDQTASVRGQDGPKTPEAVQSVGLKAQMTSIMGDAPFCDVCGHMTVRNGTCYKCLNCGNSIGCS